MPTTPLVRLKAMPTYIVIVISIIVVVVGLIRIYYKSSIEILTYIKILYYYNLLSTSISTYL